MRVQHSKYTKRKGHIK